MSKLKTGVSTGAAVKMIDEVVPMVALDVRRGIEDMEMLEASNDPVTIALSDIKVNAIRGRGPIQNALTLTLVLAMSRVFDIGNRPIEQQNKASLPLLAHHLARPDVKHALVSRLSPCPVMNKAQQQSALDDFEAAWGAHRADSDLQDALRRLRLFRDHEVAHSLFGVVPEAPKYIELFQIVSCATVLVVRAEKAAGHDPSFFDDFRDDRRVFSAAFWEAYVTGVKTFAR